MHYAVPRILHDAGMLARLFTDMDSRSGGLRWLRHVPQGVAPGALRRLQSRQPAGVPGQKTTAFNTLGLMYALRRTLSPSPAAMMRSFLWANRAFCGACAGRIGAMPARLHLQLRRSGDPPAGQREACQA